MLLNEYLESNDLFGTINSINPYAFINDNSNDSLAFSFGERTMSNNVLKLNVVKISELIIEKFGDKWDSLIGITIADFKLGAINNTVSESTTNTETDDTSSNSNLNKITGFNDAELITDTGTSSEDVKTGTGLSKTVNSSYQLDLKSLFNNLKMLDRTNIITTVQNDVANYLSIYIY